MVTIVIYDDDDVDYGHDDDDKADDHDDVDHDDDAVANGDCI